MSLYEMYGYKPSELLMNTCTGSVSTAKEWSDEAKDWEVGFVEAYEQYGELVKVKKEKNGDWIEIK